MWKLYMHLAAMYLSGLALCGMLRASTTGNSKSGNFLSAIAAVLSLPIRYRSRCNLYSGEGGGGTPLKRLLVARENIMHINAYKHNRAPPALIAMKV